MSLLGGTAPQKYREPTPLFLQRLFLSHFLAFLLKHIAPMTYKTMKISELHTFGALD